MAERSTFLRCVSCFARKEEPGPCCSCGYDSGLCAPPCRWLLPGTVIKGRYVAGKHRGSSDNDIRYLAWDLQQEAAVELVEYFPRDLVTRDVTLSETVVCIPGKEGLLEQGKQAFFEKAKLYYQCVSRISEIAMDFFARNNTCYYVRQLK